MYKNLSTGIDDMYILLLIFTRDNLNIYYLATRLINIISLFFKWHYNEVTDIALSILDKHTIIDMLGWKWTCHHISRFNARLL
jgi:hypothetical protein